MSNLNQLDVADFKMTRLSDVIDQGVLKGGVGNIEISELDESNLEELEHLIEQIQNTLGVKNKDKTLQEISKLFLDKDEPLKAAQVNIQQECTEKFLKETKYTRDELLMLASSPASKLSPPGWDEVVNQLPSAITNVQKESPIIVNKYNKIKMATINGDELDKTAINNGKGISTSKSQLLHGGINQEVQIQCDSKEQLRKELNPGQDKGYTLFKASTFPSDSLSKASTITNDSLSKASAETEQTGNKNTFIDNLIHEKLVNRPLDQPDLKVKESTSSIRKEKTTSPSAASLLFSKSSLPCSKSSLPCSKSSLSCSQSSLPCIKSSHSCIKSSLPCSQSSLPCSQSSRPCIKSSLSCSKSSLPCSQSSLPCSKSSLPCSKSSLPCSQSSLLCSICCEPCKRGVATPCCDAKACRYCAVKTLTDLVSNVGRKCWNCGKTPVATLDLIVDNDLRDAVQRFNVAEFGGN